MAGQHSSPSHARSSSSHTAPARTRSRSRDDGDITDIRNEYAERRRERTSPRRSEEEEYNVRASRAREREYYDDYEEERPSRRSTRQESERRETGRKESGPSGFGEFLRIAALMGVILLVFAFFHHVKDRVFLSDPIPVESAVTTVTPVATEEPLQEATIDEKEAAEEIEAVEEVVEDNRTEWQKKFENKFTSEVVKTENSYSSPNVSVTIETYVEEVNGYQQTWYIADIYVASIDYLKTYFAKDTYIPGGCLDEPIEDMCAATGAIFAVSGDYCSNQKNGFLVRNGQVIHDEQTTADICVLFNDGTVETYAPDGYVSEDLIARGAWQSWKFGPRLLDENGRAMTSFNSGTAVINESAPRCGFGYYEPGHYCLVVNDGRLSHSRGFLLAEFAELFEKMGCTCAYNLDGGATAVMAFDGVKFSQPSANRNPGDIFFLWDSTVAAEEEEQ